MIPCLWQLRAGCERGSAFGCVLLLPLPVPRVLGCLGHVCSCTMSPAVAFAAPRSSSSKAFFSLEGSDYVVLWMPFDYSRLVGGSVVIGCSLLHPTTSCAG